jgi:hypothetical protein
VKHSLKNGNKKRQGDGFLAFLIFYENPYFAAQQASLEVVVSVDAVFLVSSLLMQHASLLAGAAVVVWVAVTVSFV